MRFLVFAFSIFEIACAGTQPSTESLRDAQRLNAELGPLEADARLLTEGLTAALGESDDPSDALDGLARYVDANIEDMEEVAELVAAKLEALSGEAYTSYHQVFADSMSDATFGWLDACAAFLEQHPDNEGRLRGVAAALGPLRIPDPDEDE